MTITDLTTMSETRRKLCRTATALWTHDSRRPPSRDLPGVMKRTATPHMRRIMTFQLTGQWRRIQHVRSN